jgi:hypothetical protein
MYENRALRCKGGYLCENYLRAGGDARSDGLLPDELREGGGLQVRHCRGCDSTDTHGWTWRPLEPAAGLMS